MVTLALLILSSPEPTLVTSSRQVTGIARGPEGWTVATMGGVFAVPERGPTTRIDGLPSTEIQGMRLSNQGLVTVTPLGTKIMTSSKGQSLGRTGTLMEIGPWKAEFMRGLRQKRGTTWVEVPTPSRAITVLFATGSKVAIGTADQGAFELREKTWHPLETPHRTLPSHNVVGFARHEDTPWAFTLDGGILEFGKSGWAGLAGPILTPRQMTKVHEGTLIRDSDSRLWSIDRTTVTPPRKSNLTFIASNPEEEVLHLKYGGLDFWSKGSKIQIQGVEMLKGHPTTVGLITPEALWIGTQDGGLGRVDRKTQRFAWSNRGQGLGDDWITALEQLDEGQVAVGTFVGGLSIVSSEPANPTRRIKATAGSNVTDLERDAEGNLWIATRTGLYRLQTGSPDATKVQLPFGWPTEIQALLVEGSGLTMGCRTGIIFMPWSKLR